jgi:chemotaxis protein histidine kinase CheA
VPAPDALARLIEGFVSEASELCEAITRDVLALERGGSDSAAQYEKIARGLHTLKGGAGTLGLDDLALLSHRLEDTVLQHQSLHQRLPSDAVDRILRGLDAFMLRLRVHAEGRAVELDGTHDRLPSAASLAPAPIIRDETVQAIDRALEEAELQTATAGPQTWRVAAEQVIALMREAERLRLVRLRLDERRRDLARTLSIVSDLWRGPQSSDVRALIASIDGSIAADGLEVASIVEALEHEVKGIATQPVRVIVEPLHRAVRDHCRSTGKQAKLSLVGGDISLDRRVLDALKGPLVHLIRNAVDHGIESPAERRARGKHEEGAIVIRVEQQGNVVFIEVSDDGAGLRVDAIRRAAIEKEVVTEGELARMDQQRIYNLVFVPAVSTAREVTPTSGRGIGMDAVKKGLEELHGHVELQSAPQQGTRVLLTFPAGLGSSPILIVRTDEQDFGISMLSVENVIPTNAANLHVGRNEIRLSRDDQVLPVVDLGVALGLRQPRAVSGGQLLIVHSQGQRVAVAVDEVMGDTDLVIRPLPREVALISIYQGVSSMARGQLVLVLRPDWLIGAAAISPATSSGRNALVVDDSLTAVGGAA